MGNVTPDELLALADAATENWRVEPGQSQYLFVGGLHRFRTLMRSDADARLAALAPDLARRCAELLQACQDWGPERGQLIHAALDKLTKLKAPK